MPLLIILLRGERALPDMLVARDHMYMASLPRQADMLQPSRLNFPGAYISQSAERLMHQGHDPCLTSCWDARGNDMPITLAELSGGGPVRLLDRH